MTSVRGHGAQPASERELRKFGLSTGAAFAVMFGLVLPWLFSYRTPVWPFVVCAALAGPALLLPRSLRPIQRGWMWGAEKLGAFNARLILGAVFYTVVTPMGCLRRLLGFDPLGLRPSPAASFRKPARPRAPQSMERPF